MAFFSLLVPLAMFFTAAEPTVLLDQSFELVQPDRDGPPLGTYALKAKEEQGTIRITESAKLTIRGSKIELTSTVTYQADGEGGWSFARAEGATGFDDEPLMQVVVEPDGLKWTVEAKYLGDTRGEVFDEPKVFKRTIEVPKGPVLFSSAAAVMGPRIQTKAGEQAIVWVEFPDDLDEPIQVKQGFSVRRTEADGDGDYSILVVSEYQTIGPILLDQDGKLRPNGRFGKFQLQEKQGE